MPRGCTKGRDVHSGCQRDVQWLYIGNIFISPNNMVRGGHVFFKAFRVLLELEAGDRVIGKEGAPGNG